jgi:hypothetical protein
MHPVIKNGSHNARNSEETAKKQRRNSEETAKKQQRNSEETAKHVGAGLYVCARRRVRICRSRHVIRHLENYEKKNVRFRVGRRCQKS